MKVYVVSHGYDYEDAMVMKVFSDEEKAVEWVFSQPLQKEEDEDGNIIEHKIVEILSSNERYFTDNYGDYYVVRGYEVE